jgi:hypothetical protein
MLIFLYRLHHAGDADQLENRDLLGMLEGLLGSFLDQRSQEKSEIFFDRWGKIPDCAGRASHLVAIALCQFISVAYHPASQCDMIG